MTNMMVLRIGKFMKTASIIEATSGWGEWGALIESVELLFGMLVVLKMVSGPGWTTLWMYITPLTGPFNNTLNGKSYTLSQWKKTKLCIYL